MANSGPPPDYCTFSDETPLNCERPTNTRSAQTASWKYPRLLLHNRSAMPTKSESNILLLNSGYPTAPYKNQIIKTTLTFFAEPRSRLTQTG